MYLALTGLAACGTGGNKPIDREKVKQEMKDRQIKRVSEPELTDAAYQTGAALASMAESILLEKLNDFYATIETSGVAPDEQAVTTPLSQLISLVLDSLNRNSGHSISLINLGLEGLHPDTLDIEKQLLEAYQYNQENNIPSEDNIQRSGTDYLLFTRPVTSKSGICLPTLSERAGDGGPDGIKNGATYFCGMWSIMLSKKEIIKSL